METGYMRAFSIVWLAAVGAASGSGDFDHALALYGETRYEEALKVLDGLPSKDVAAWALTGKIHYGLGAFKKAAEALEKAAGGDSRNSSFHLWLGRAYGRRAETSSFLTAPGLASKARRSFERAVELDPRNVEAISDLLEYYLEAPGFLGGGIEKAEALARRIEPVHPAEHQQALARIAEKQGDFTKAERHWRRAAEMAPNQAGRLIDLAKFLALRRRFPESDGVFAKAGRLAPDSPKLLFARAGAYIGAKRNIETARELLARYLKSSLTPDDPPRREAERLLKQATGG
jgi:tetratricopeptide (TPR) repeat protein